MNNNNPAGEECITPSSYTVVLQCVVLERSGGETRKLLYPVDSWPVVRMLESVEL